MLIILLEVLLPFITVAAIPPRANVGFEEFVKHYLPQYPLYKYGNRLGKQKIAVYGLEFEDLRLPDSWAEHVKYRLERAIEYWRNVTGENLFEYEIKGVKYIPYSIGALADEEGWVTQETMEKWFDENAPNWPEYREAMKEGYTAVMFALPLSTPFGGTYDYLPGSEDIKIHFSPFTLIYRDKPFIVVQGAADPWGFYVHELSHLIGFMSPAGEGTLVGRGPTPSAPGGALGNPELDFASLTMHYALIPVPPNAIVFFWQPTWESIYLKRVSRPDLVLNYTLTCAFAATAFSWNLMWDRGAYIEHSIESNVTGLHAPPMMIRLDYDGNIIHYKGIYRSYERLESHVAYTFRVEFKVKMAYKRTLDDHALVNVTFTDYRLVVESSYYYYSRGCNETSARLIEPGTVLESRDGVFVLPADPENKTYFELHFEKNIFVNKKAPLADLYVIGNIFNPCLAENRTMYWLYWVNGSQRLGPSTYPIRAGVNIATFFRGKPCRPSLLEIMALYYALGKEPPVQVIDARRSGWKKVEFYNSTASVLRVKLYPNGHPKQNMALIGFSYTKMENGRFSPASDIWSDEFFWVTWIEVRSPEYDPVREPIAVVFKEGYFFLKGKPAGRVVYMWNTELPGHTFHKIKIVGKDSDGGYWVELWRGYNLKGIPPYINATNVVVIAPEGWKPIPYIGEPTYIFVPLWRKGRIYGYRIVGGVLLPQGLFIALESETNNTVYLRVKCSAFMVARSDVAYAFKYLNESEAIKYLISVGKKLKSTFQNPGSGGVYVYIAKPVPVKEGPYETPVTWRAEVELKSSDGKPLPSFGWWWIIYPDSQDWYIRVNRLGDWYGVPKKLPWGGCAWVRYGTRLRILSDNEPDTFINQSSASAQFYDLVEEWYRVTALFNSPLIAHGPMPPTLRVLKWLGIKYVETYINKTSWKQTIRAPVKVIRVRIPKSMLNETAVVYVPDEKKTVEFTINNTYVIGRVPFLDLNITYEQVRNMSGVPYEHNLLHVVLDDNPMITYYILIAPTPDMYRPWLLRESPVDRVLIYYWTSFLEEVGVHSKPYAAWELYRYLRIEMKNINGSGWEDTNYLYYPSCLREYGIKLKPSEEYLSVLNLYMFEWSRSRGYSVSLVAGPAKLVPEWNAVVESVLGNWSGSIVPLHLPARVVEEDNGTVTLEVAVWTGGFEGGEIYVGKVLNVSGYAVIGWMRDRYDYSVHNYAVALAVFYPYNVTMQVYASAPLSASVIDATKPSGKTVRLELGKLREVQEKNTKLKKESAAEEESEDIYRVAVVFIVVLLVFAAVLVGVGLAVGLLVLLARRLLRKRKQSSFT
mgnify:CR=1 FL=1